MKKKVLLCSLVSALSGFSGVAAATTGVVAGSSGPQVVFKGKLTTQPCDLKIEGGGVVNLGEISSSVINRVGYSSTTPFTVEFRECPNVGSPKLQFIASVPDPVAPAELFGVSGDTTGIAIEILNADESWRVKNGAELPLALLPNGNYDLVYKVRVAKSTQNAAAPIPEVLEDLSAGIAYQPAVPGKSEITVSETGEFTSAVNLVVTY
ncbi:fimbrial protein [Aeromonas dhakensis]|uniref:fimbrial protein n=1 Tax=Aeromonas dhakensis TaxID=196024 RepID=UPI0039856C27